MRIEGLHDSRNFIGISCNQSLIAKHLHFVVLSRDKGKLRCECLGRAIPASSVKSLLQSGVLNKQTSSGHPVRG